MPDRVVLGIDPGLANTGWGVIQASPGKLSALAYGCVTTLSETDRAERLHMIHTELTAVIERYHPAELAIEAVYFGANVKSAMMTGEARGVALLAAAENQMAVKEYSPTQVKQVVSGNGYAVKSQVQYMVKVFLHLRQLPQPDHAADALAIAICHAQLQKNRWVVAENRGKKT